MKSINHSYTLSAKIKVKAFFKRLAETLLATNGDVPSYLFLATLADCFDFDVLQEQSKSNLMNVDLRINYLMTLLTKLRLKNSSD